MAEVKLNNELPEEKDYPSNSKKPKDGSAPALNATGKIISGTASIRKKSLAKKFAETFIADDIADVRGHIVNDIVVPAVKDAIVDTIENAARMIFYGDSARRGGGSRRQGGGAFYDYNAISSNRSRNRGSDSSNSPRSIGIINDIIFDSSQDANDVINMLLYYINEYGQATLGEYYEFAGLNSSYVDHNWGWTNYDLLNNVNVRRTREGWVVDLPKPVALKR